jgi:ribonuclease P protein component
LVLKRFTKRDRLLKRSDFLKLSLSGTKIQNKHFVLIYSDNEKKENRMGITVTKRVGKSVMRNKIKRYCREFFRLNRCVIPGKKDINIIAKKNALALDSKQMFQTLENIFKKIN